MISLHAQAIKIASISSISVYLTSNRAGVASDVLTELAIGTEDGKIRIVMENPISLTSREPLLYQTLSVHQDAIVKLILTKKYLISVCANDNHVRSWKVVRFRGLIATQPGTIPLSSFNVNSENSNVATELFGKFDEPAIFIQPLKSCIRIVNASTGQGVTKIHSPHDLTATHVTERDHPSRLGSRPRRFLVAGNATGSLEVYDLVTAFELDGKLAD